MKQLTCEMCGSTELIKQDGFFVCQNCGIKYSVEEAKKMMLGENAEVQGVVKADDITSVEKYLANARRAKEKEDWEEAEKYYKLVEQNDPTNIEAIFYSTFGKAKTSLVDADVYKRAAVFNVLKNSLSIISNNYRIENKEENEFAIKSITNDLLNIFCGSFVYTEWGDGRTNKGETYMIFSELLDAFHALIRNVQAKDPKIYIYETFISFLNKLQSSVYVYEKSLYKIIDGWRTLQIEALRKTREEKTDKYWEKHKDEKKLLETKKSELEKIKERYVTEIATIRKKNEEVPSMASLIEKQKEIESLEAQKKALGLFKIKEKKAIQEQIDVLLIEKDKIKTKVVAEQQEIEKEIIPIREELNKTIARIKEIDNELNMDREVEDDDE